MDSRDRDFPRQGNELTSCQTSPSRKGPGVVESLWRGDGHIFHRLPREPSLPEQDVSPSSANCATEIGNYVRRDRFDIENWKRFKWQSGNLECHGEMRLETKRFGSIRILLIISRTSSQRNVNAAILINESYYRSVNYSLLRSSFLTRG